MSNIPLNTLHEDSGNELPPQRTTHMLPADVRKVSTGLLLGSKGQNQSTGKLYYDLVDDAYWSQLRDLATD